jgi:hypothetical protein
LAAPKNSNGRVVSKPKAAVFAIALAVLIVNFILLLRGLIGNLEFFGVIVIVAISANAAFSLINRRDRKKQQKRQ